MPQLSAAKYFPRSRYTCPRVTCASPTEQDKSPMRRSRRQTPPATECMGPSAAALHAHGAQKGSPGSLPIGFCRMRARTRCGAAHGGRTEPGGAAAGLQNFDRWVCPAAAYKGRACKRGRHSPAITRVHYSPRATPAKRNLGKRRSLPSCNTSAAKGSRHVKYRSRICATAKPRRAPPKGARSGKFYVLIRLRTHSAHRAPYRGPARL